MIYLPKDIQEGNGFCSDPRTVTRYCTSHIIKAFSTLDKKKTLILLDFLVVSWFLWPTARVSTFWGSFSKRVTTDKEKFLLPLKPCEGPGSHIEWQTQPATESLAYVHIDGAQNQNLPQQDFTFVPDLLPGHTLINEASSPFLNLEARSCQFPTVILKS